MLEPRREMHQAQRLRTRRPIVLSADTLVRSEPPSEPGGVLVVRPAVTAVDLVAWAADHREWIESRLATHGGILFRGFQIASAEALERAAGALAGDPLEYHERSSPRTLAGRRVYTSTEHPPNQEIFLHNENSYQHVWPLRVLFCCVTPATTGGRTPLADTRLVLERIDPGIRREFVERGVLYVRNFSPGLGLRWQDVFQTDDRSAVEAYCRGAGISCTWHDGNRLTTRQVRAAVESHPRTGETVWFNHATFFHVSTLEPSIRSALLAELGEDGLPNNTYYGDGGAIEPRVMDELRAAYRDAARGFAWETGDLLLLDNMLMAHGREPYTGARRILVALATPMSWNDLA